MRSRTEILESVNRSGLQSSILEVLLDIRDALIITPSHEDVVGIVIDDLQRGGHIKEALERTGLR